MLSEAQIKRAWEGMLAAEIRSNYFAELAHGYSTQQRKVTWGTLLFSSGAVATTLGALPTEIAWAKFVLPLGAAALSLYSLVQQNQKRSTDAADLHFRWNKLARNYERLWENVYGDEAESILNSLSDRAAELSKSSTAFPNGEKALLKWQMHVENHHGVLQPQS